MIDEFRGHFDFLGFNLSWHLFFTILKSADEYDIIKQR